jgi:glycosyltransferase involved in cell wall biosynthesis
LAKGKKMKVAIDSGPLTSGHSVRGIGVYTKQLTQALKKDRSVKLDVVDFAKVDLAKYDIAHYPVFNPYFMALPLTNKTKTVVTIHDLIYLIYPDQYPPGIRGRLKFLVNKKLIRKADAIITTSETSKKDIVRFLAVDQEKIFPIYQAPAEAFRPVGDKDLLRGVKDKYNLPDRFVLYVGDVNYNKNLLGLAEACKIAKIPLVIVGKQAASSQFDRNHPENRSWVEFLKKYGQDKDILRVGFVPDEELAPIYNLANLYAQVSFYEGFGLSVLQAFACSTPAVCSKTQALVEIGQGACFFADPKDPKDIASKLRQAIENEELRSQLVETGKILVKNYSWEKTARETIEVYKKVLLGK